MEGVLQIHMKVGLKPKVILARYTCLSTIGVSDWCQVSVGLQDDLELGSLSLASAGRGCSLTFNSIPGDL